MKKILLPVLLLCAFTVKAQDFPVYKPIPYGNQKPQSQQSEEENTQVVDAYIANASNRLLRKVKLKIRATDMGIVISSYRELTESYWKPAIGKANKLSSFDTYAREFEYKGYAPALGTIYF